MPDFNLFAEVGAELLIAAKGLPKIIADKGVIHVQDHITANGQVLSGYMRDSVVSAEVNETEATLTVGADYGAYQNYGTRYLPPRPFWEPALVETEIDLNEAIAALSAQLGTI